MNLGLAVNALKQKIFRPMLYFLCMLQQILTIPLKEK